MTLNLPPEDDVRDECKYFIFQILKKEPAERLRTGLDMTSHPVCVHLSLMHHLLILFAGTRLRGIAPLGSGFRQGTSLL
jgi:hypothetical protein